MNIPKYLYLIAHNNKHYVFTMGDLNKYTSMINSLVGSVNWPVTQLTLTEQGAGSATYSSNSGECITVRI